MKILAKSKNSRQKPKIQSQIKILVKNGNFRKNKILGKNLNLGQKKTKFYSKIEILVKIKTLGKSKKSSRNFPQNLTLTLEILVKDAILGKNQKS